jgi:hypothetical protein
MRAAAILLPVANVTTGCPTHAIATAGPVCAALTAVNAVTGCELQQGSAEAAFADEQQFLHCETVAAAWFGAHSAHGTATNRTATRHSIATIDLTTENREGDCEHWQCELWQRDISSSID